jgi:ATP-dependent RNA helicase DDX3X
MGNLSINDSQHAPQGNGPPGRAAYIPPHLRGRPNMDGASAPPPGPGAGAPRYEPSKPPMPAGCH